MLTPDRKKEEMAPILVRRTGNATDTELGVEETCQLPQDEPVETT
jgi:hypothetical protein